MEKPTLRMALHRVTPPLPDPYEFAARISASLRFIDQNPAAVMSDLTPEMLELWSLDPEEHDALQACFERIIGEMEMIDAEIGPRLLSSLIIFTHIYLTYCRLEDFADLDNFAATYFKFQTLLYRTSHTTGHQFRLFDLENLDQTLDEIRQNMSPKQ